MKKLAMAVTAMAAVATIATAETVTSANIVGYSKVDCPAGLTIVAVNFTGGQSVDDLLGPMNSDGTAANSDKVLIWDGSAYRSYWYCDGTGYGADYDGHWLDDSWAQATEVIPEGSAIWVNNKSGSASKLLMSGEVSVSETNAVALPVGLTMIGNPYPTTLALGVKGQDVSVNKKYSQLAEGAYSDGTAANSDKILFWDGEKYVSYWYCDGTGYGADFDGQWLNDDWEKQDRLEIPLGVGIWYVRKGSDAGTWVKSKNF